MELKGEYFNNEGTVCDDYIMYLKGIVDIQEYWYFKGLF